MSLPISCTWNLRQEVPINMRKETKVPGLSVGSCQSDPSKRSIVIQVWVSLVCYSVCISILKLAPTSRPLHPSSSVGTLRAANIHEHPAMHGQADPCSHRSMQITDKCPECGPNHIDLQALTWEKVQVHASCSASFSCGVLASG
jgi:hypothetical protein